MLARQDTVSCETGGQSISWRGKAAGSLVGNKPKLVASKARLPHPAVESAQRDQPVVVLEKYANFEDDICGIPACGP